MWHVHGSYTTSMVCGDPTFLLPVTADRGPDGRGRAQTWAWPPNAVEVSATEAADTEVDLVVLQRPEELHGLAERWLGGRRPGRDVPAIYLEHNAPQGPVNEMRHPAADRPDLLLVHVTHFNNLFWDAGTTPTRVIEHGVVDSGARYTGELARGAAVINEPVRRRRVTGTDLLGRLAEKATLDLFGMGTEQLAVGGVHPVGNAAQTSLHDELARRRVYVHPIRWTSLGLSLIEAMTLAMPVVALATTEVADAVPSDAGVVSTDIDRLRDGLSELVGDPALASAVGQRARTAALRRYGLDRFLADWAKTMEEVAT